MSPVRSTVGLFTMSRQTHRAPIGQSPSHVRTSTPLPLNHTRNSNITHPKQQKNPTAASEKTLTNVTAISLNTRLTNCVTSNAQFQPKAPTKDTSCTADTTGVDIFGDNIGKRYTMLLAS